ncbi:MAG: phosphate ABC transporter substrate-binding protein PstS [Deltaproteobacteria bacterium]|nr:phosphate ABC transporter substrate-binding protein PstS [Deltaproteobacteria bacterium]
MRILKNVVLTAIVVLVFGCTSNTKVSSTDSAGDESIDIHGAGATFPYPLYSKWMDEYHKIDPRVRINYQSIGSGGGIRQITERTVDFGATDAAMKESELAKLAKPIFHLPMTLGAVVVTYNLPGIKSLKLTPELIAGIFLGEITKWNDKRIITVNQDIALPDQAIAVVSRSDGSGTTAVFTQYLAKISQTWKEKVGEGKSVKFPVGLGAKGNEGVAGQVKTSPGNIGYVELAYAIQTGLPYATIKNKAGSFVQPTLESITAAAAGSGDATQLPEDLRMSIVDAEGKDAYPIAAFTYILVYEEQAAAVKGKALVQFLWWAIHEGQKLAPPLHYAPLPQAVVTKVETKLKSLHDTAGKSLL